MILINAHYEITDAPVAPVGKIERDGRTCYKSHDKMGSGTADKFVRMLIKRGHLAMIELGGTMTVKFTVDRGVSHELVRHRLASFAQESTRYCNYRGGVAFVIPPWVEDLEPGTFSRYDQKPPARVGELAWFDACLTAEFYYLSLLEVQWRPEQARSALPNSLATEIVVQANMREWRHIFGLRASPAANPQMQEVMVPLLAQCADRWPALFEDLVERVEAA